MKKKFFGTDGIRGKVNTFPITTDFFRKLVISLGYYLKKTGRKKIFIGKDTRVSGDTIEKILTTTFSSIGFDCIKLGITTTPIVSFMTRKHKADLGIMISASHNPYFDNGIKIFNGFGQKLSDREELKIESIIDTKPIKISKTKFLTKISKNLNFESYEKEIKKVIPKNINFKDLKVVLDCANGSAYKIAPKIFLNLGVNLILESINPNGRNINQKCGALFPNNLTKKVLSNKADIGFAYDGDADRLIVCDEKGEIINGDKILAIISSSLLKQEKLKSKYIVSTKMSNLGLSEYLSSIGLKLYKTSVGDRYVTNGMKKKNSNLGGEQSGHIIFSDFSSTGDAILSSLQILTILKIENKKLSEILSSYNVYPQKLLNFKLNFDPEIILKDKKFIDLINLHKNRLKKKGNILVRKSGTEKLLRLMVQSFDKEIMINTMKTLENYILLFQKKL